MREREAIVLGLFAATALVAVLAIVFTAVTVHELASVEVRVQALERQVQGGQP